MDSYLEDAVMENAHYFVFPDELETMAIEWDETATTVDIDLLPTYYYRFPTPLPPPPSLTSFNATPAVPVKKLPNGPLKEADQKLSVTYGKIMAEREGLDIAQMRTLYKGAIATAPIHQRMDASIISMNTMLKGMFPGQNGKKGLRKHIALALLYVFYENPTMTTFRTAKGRVSRVLLAHEGKVRQQGPWGSSVRGSGRVKGQ